MRARLVGCVAIATALVGAQASADDTCVKLTPGAIYSRPARDAKVGTINGRVVAKLDKAGDWDRVWLDDIRPVGKETQPFGEVFFYVPKQSARVAPCPPGATVGVLGALSSRLQLHWPDGSDAGSVLEATDVAEEVSGRDRVVDLVVNVPADGETAAHTAKERDVCFDHRVGGLTVHVCGDCHRIDQGLGPGLGAERPLKCE